MSDTNPTEGEQQPAIAINGQYIKDLSFEAPNTPGIFKTLQNTQPEININVDVNANKIEDGDNLFESAVRVTAELKVGDEVGFIAELTYAGLFTVNVPEEHLGAVLLIECPRLLFPFARNILSDITRDGGFVPLMLQPIDFGQLYQANLKAQADAAGEDVDKLVVEKGSDKDKAKDKGKKPN